MSSIQSVILAKKAALVEAVSTPLSALARDCATVWPDADALDQKLLGAIEGIPHCQTLYAWGVDSVQISSLILPNEAQTQWRGNDLSDRPYLKNNLPFKGLMLSSIYRSTYQDMRCMTVLQAVRRESQLQGFIAADFGLRGLLGDAKLMPQESQWQQFKGDPAVRGTVFMQERVTSRFDEHMDEVLDAIHTLIAEQGVFQVKIHFSSGRCSYWLYEDPYNYRIHGVEEVVQGDICLAYPSRDYPADACVSPDQVREILEEFKQLRFADETIYLRSASINIINGIVGLTFSCDGSHYMSADEFLAKNLGFWLGEFAAG